MSAEAAGYEAEPTDVAAETAWLSEITDPMERYHRATAIQAHHEAVTARLADIRAHCAGEMHRAGLSFGKIGAVLGCSRGRAQQLVERSRDAANPPSCYRGG